MICKRSCFVLLLLGLSITAYDVLHGRCEPLLMQEKIVGIDKTQKQLLKKYASYQPYAMFLGMPIKKWLYRLGERHFHPRKIENDIFNIKKIYTDRLTKTMSEKEKMKLMTKKDKIIHSKEQLLLHGNRLMRMGEKPLYYDLNYIEYRRKRFLHCLCARGYLDVDVFTKINMQNNLALVTYYIALHHLYKIVSIQFQVTDPFIQELLSKHLAESFVKIGHPYCYQDLLNEQERLVTLLSNNGYYECNEQHISFLADVSQKNYTIALTTVVDKKGNLKRTTIGSVVVNIMPRNREAGNNQLNTITHEGICFYFLAGQYPCKQLVSKIAMRPGDWYDKRKILETYQRLNHIALFESITILPKLEEGRLVIYIHVIPYERINLQMKLGGECVNFNLRNWRPTLKAIPTIRPLFARGMGMASMEIAIEGGQWDGRDYNFFNRMACGLRCKFTTPRFMCFLPNKLDLALERFRPTTIVEMGYHFSRDYAENKHKIDMEWGYKWHGLSRSVDYQLVPIYLATTFIHTKTGYTGSQVNNLSSVHPSFLTALVIRFIFHDLSPFTHWPLWDDYDYSWMVRLDIENGGLYESFLKIKRFFPKLLTYHYFKLDLSCRYPFHVAQGTTLVYHLKGGMLISYGKDGKVCADKQYEIGGFNSIRAWDLHRLGPGFYESNRDDRHKVRKGDLLLLSNIELRQKLVGHLEGALFLDVGNIWRLSKEALPEERFRFSDFYKALAVGAGVGLRLNYHNAFVLCGDLAIPLSKFFKKNDSKERSFKFHLAIGYPF